MSSFMEMNFMVELKEIWGGNLWLLSNKGD
jgi:hypothetical protein